MPAEAATSGLQVAVVGAGTMLGQELRQLLGERSFPVGQLSMMGEGAEVGRLVEHDGAASLIGELDEDLLRRVDLLFVCDRGPAARRAIATARGGRAFIVDLVDAEAGPGDPVVNMLVNAGDLPAAAPARVRSPHQAVQALSAALAPLAAGGRLQEVRGTVLTPVSDHGKPAVQELVQQTSGTLNFGSRPQEVLARQVAFNVVPHALMHVQQGWPDVDARLSAELAGILALEPAAVSLRGLLVPVFHGTAALVSVTMDPLPAAARRRELLSGGPLALGPMTPAELDESRAIHVTDLGDEGERRLGLWVVSDNLRGGSVANGVAIAEALAAARRSGR